MKQVWQIDSEFKRLSVPLSPEEERKLENLIQVFMCFRERTNGHTAERF